MEKTPVDCLPDVDDSLLIQCLTRSPDLCSTILDALRCAFGWATIANRCSDCSVRNNDISLLTWRSVTMLWAPCIRVQNIVADRHFNRWFLIVVTGEF